VAKTKVGSRAGSLRGKRILLSNDDGIAAPGLKSLEKIARQLSDDVWVVAPESEQSGAGHSLTLTQPLRLRKISARKYAVQGTPTDCVMMAINKILADKKPDLLLSGVNRGANMGEDVTYSGTIAAAMEGTILDVPSMALSLRMLDRRVAHWSTAEQHAPKLIRRLFRLGWPADVLININFPDVIPGAVEGVEITRQGRRDIRALTIDERIDAREQPYYWLGFRPTEDTPKKGTDITALDNHRISVTPLHLDLTESRTLRELKQAFAG
jgi:5'-nucleotidase